MCDIWKNTDSQILSKEEILEILSYFPKDTDISLTWWEPFLHPEIKDILKAIYKEGYTVNTLSTNGIMETKILKIIQDLKQEWIPTPKIHISIDGYEDVHDSQRGVKGAFKKSISSIYALKKENIAVKLKYTITRENLWDIKKCFELAKKLALEITFKIVDNDINYTNRLKTTEILSKKEKTYISSVLAEIKQDPFTKHLISYLNTEKLPFLCKTPEISLFIMANGEVYPCTKYNSIWNIRKNSLKNLIGNSLHLGIIEEVKKISCSKCFSPHGASKNISYELY